MNEHINLDLIYQAFSSAKESYHTRLYSDSVRHCNEIKAESHFWRLKKADAT